MRARQPAGARFRQAYDVVMARFRATIRPAEPADDRATIARLRSLRTPMADDLARDLERSRRIPPE